jgi:hypothetical protein
MLFFIKLPNNDNNTLDSSFKMMQYSLEDNATIILTKFTLKTDSTSNFSVDLSPLGLSQGGSIVKSSDLNLVQSYFNNNILNINSDKNFFFVYFSKDFVDSSIPILPSANYSIGGVEKINVLSYNQLLSIKNMYNSGDNMNTFFKIPENLGFAIKSDIKDFSLNDNIPKDVSIEAMTKVYNILSPSGDLETKQITFELWK